MTARLIGSNRRVLLVEDDDDLRDLMQWILEGNGYEVEVAANGAIALDLVRREANPLVILLDMRMPIMDGWQFARAYRELPQPHSPIVVLTAAANAAAWADEVQAASYLAKPFRLDDLLAEIERHISQPD